MIFNYKKAQGSPVKFKQTSHKKTIKLKKNKHKNKNNLASN